MNKVFKVGLIGCGHIAETYFRGHQYFNNFKIVACADINHQAAEKCAKLYNIKSMTVNEILKDRNVTNLDICELNMNIGNKQMQERSLNTVLDIFDKLAFDKTQFSKK